MAQQYWQEVCRWSGGRFTITTEELECPKPDIGDPSDLVFVSVFSHTPLPMPGMGAVLMFDPKHRGQLHVTGKQITRQEFEDQLSTEDRSIVRQSDPHTMWILTNPGITIGVQCSFEILRDPAFA